MNRFRICRHIRDWMCVSINFAFPAMRQLSFCLISMILCYTQGDLSGVSTGIPGGANCLTKILRGQSVAAGGQMLQLFSADLKRGEPRTSRRKEGRERQGRHL